MRNLTIPSIWLLTAATCLCSAAAHAGNLDFTDTATGLDALLHENGGHDNTADGYIALNANETGVWNSAVGSQALYSNTIGEFNTATGGAALFSNTTGSSNTATGIDALFSNTTGGYNAASGDSALFSNTTGGLNTASGAYALYSNTTGGYNTAGGTNALYSNHTGINNVALGYQALYGNVSGIDNVALGTNALAAMNGTSNIAIGYNAGNLTTTGDGNIYIGHPGINGSESKVMRIGKGQHKTLIAGIAGKALSGATVVVNSNGQLGVVASSARYKQDIQPLGGAAEKLAQLRPVSFRYQTEPEATHYGLIAEEVDRVMPELVVRDGEKRPDSVQYLELIPLLLQQWKAQQAEIARQRALIERQEAALTELRRTLAIRFTALGTADRGDRAGGK